MRANVAEVDQSLAVGDRNAKRVLRTRAFWAGLARLGEEFGIAGDGLVSFMSASVAARLEDEAFFAGLARLGKEFGIAGDGLVSFMSDGVAARLEDKAFWAGRPAGRVRHAGDGLVTFMTTRSRRGWRTRRSGLGWRGWASSASLATDWLRS